MSTNGTYKFVDTSCSITVYKHHDNYPSGALGFIEKALEYASKLPRFSALYFCSAFVIANKTAIELIDNSSANHQEYNYEISFQKDGGLYIICRQYDSQPIFSGTIENFRLWIDENNNINTNKG